MLCSTVGSSLKSLSEIEHHRKDSFIMVAEQTRPATVLAEEAIKATQQQFTDTMEGLTRRHA